MSGGYDSRVLAILCSTIGLKPYCFTYSKTGDSRCFEVENARFVAERLGFNWDEINIDNECNWLNTCVELYGVSSHAHFGHALEFYSNIRNKYQSSTCTVISGYLGDIFAGKTLKQGITSSTDLYNMYSMTSGNYKLSSQLMHAPFELGHVKNYFNENQALLKNPKTAVIDLYRNKSCLLSYLTRIPEYFNMSVICPFAEPNVALSMLNLPEDRRRGRKWQFEFIKRHGLSDPPGRKTYTMYRQKAFRSSTLRPLDRDLLSKYIRIDKVDEINKYINLLKSNKKLSSFLLYYSIARDRTRNSNLKYITRFMPADKLLHIYCEYMVLLPLDNLLKRARDEDP